MSTPVPSARDYAGLSLRELVTRYLDLLGSSVRDRAAGRSVVAHEALDRIAVSEAISRDVRNGRQVNILVALNAGAGWKSVADVLDSPQVELRDEFRQWVLGQRELYDALEQDCPGLPPAGLSRAHADAALRLDADAAREPMHDHGRD
jgi:DNA-binding SARP family transcriptional activator